MMMKAPRNWKLWRPVLKIKIRFDGRLEAGLNYC